MVPWSWQAAAAAKPFTKRSFCKPGLYRTAALVCRLSMRRHAACRKQQAARPARGPVLVAAWLLPEPTHQPGSLLVHSPCFPSRYNYSISYAYFYLVRVRGVGGCGEPGRKDSTEFIHLGRRLIQLFETCVLTALKRSQSEGGAPLYPYFAK